MNLNYSTMDDLVEKDALILSKYSILDKLGEGCFGHIYKVKNKKKNQISALKVQLFDKRQRRKSTLINQIKIMKKLDSVSGVPVIKATGKWEFGFYIEIQFLRSSLYEQRNKQYTIQEINRIGRDLLQILKKIHELGVVHRDLKPQNIMKDHNDNLFIIDFGLSYCISSRQEQKIRGFVGTPRYACLAAHQGKHQYGKDDIQSLLYVLGFIYSKTLPWIKINIAKEKRLEEIQKLKQKLALTYFKKISISFFHAFEYITELSKEQEVDYEYLINLFTLNRTFTLTKSKSKEQLRRNSENPNLLMKQAMVFNNFLSSKEKEEGSKNIFSIHNYSQVPQFQCFQIIQTIADKIFFDKEHIQFDEESLNQALCQEPHLENMEKYFQNFEFKNPFINPP